MARASAWRVILAAFLCTVSAANAHAQVINSPPSAAQSTLLAGEELNLFDGAVPPASIDAASGSVINVYADSLSFTRFNTSGEVNLLGEAEIAINALSPTSTINLHDGVILGGSSTFGGVVTNVFGGQIGFNFSMWNDVLNVFDGVVSDGLVVAFFCEVNLYGGTVGMPEGFNGSKMNVFAGAFPNGFHVGERSIFTASGGSFGDMFRVDAEAEVHLIGTEFLVAGVPVDNLPVGASVVLDTRDVVLTARLRDGTLVNLDLDNAVGDGPSWFSSDAVLRLTRVPEPHSTSVLLVPFVATTLAFRSRRKSSVSERVCEAVRR